MAITLIVRSTDSETGQAVSFDAPRVVIGRGASCDLRLPDPSVSLRHASIRQRGSDYIVLDEGSTNGTFVGPVRLSPHAPRGLRSEDLVRVGRVWLEFRFEPQPITLNPALATRELALDLVERALTLDGEEVVPRVEVTKGPDQGTSLVLAEANRHYVVGRSASADLALNDIDASRRHIEVFRRHAQVLVRDLGSKNGTRLGATTLTADRETPWTGDANLVVGANVLSLWDPVGQALQELEQAADEVLPPDADIMPPDGVAANPAVRTVEAPEEVPPAEASATAAQPRRTQRRRPTGVGATDALIVVFALLVLGASLLALSWLLDGR